MDKLQKELVNTYFRSRLQKGNIISQEIDGMPDDILNDYIKDAISKGLKRHIRLGFSEKSFNRLRDDLKEQLVNNIIWMDIPLTDFEYNFLPDEEKWRYILNSQRLGFKLGVDIIKKSNDNLKLLIYQIKISNHEVLTDDEFRLIPEKMVNEYINNRIKSGGGGVEISDYQFGGLSSELKLKVIESRINNKKTISSYKYSFLSNEMKLKYLEELKPSTNNLKATDILKFTPRSVILSYYRYLIINRLWDESNDLLTVPLRMLLIKLNIIDGNALTGYQYEISTDKMKKEYIKKVALSGRSLSEYQKQNSTKEILDYYDYLLNLKLQRTSRNK